MATRSREGPGCLAWPERHREKLAARLKAPGSRFGQREGDWKWRQTCWHLSASLQGERETPGRQKQHKGTQVHLGRVPRFHNLEDVFIIQNADQCFKRCWLVVSLYGSSHSGLALFASSTFLLCGSARAAGAPITFVNFYYVTRSQSEWLMSLG